MSDVQRIDWMLREWYWKPFASPYEAAKDILKLFGKRRCQHIVRYIAEMIQGSPDRPWETAEAISHIVHIAGKKRAA